MQIRAFSSQGSLAVSAGDRHEREGPRGEAASPQEWIPDRQEWEGPGGVAARPQELMPCCPFCALW